MVLPLLHPRKSHGLGFCSWYAFATRESFSNRQVVWLCVIAFETCIYIHKQVILEIIIVRYWDD